MAKINPEAQPKLEVTPDSFDPKTRWTIGAAIARALNNKYFLKSPGNQARFTSEQLASQQTENDTLLWRLTNLLKLVNRGEKR